MEALLKNRQLLMKLFWVGFVFSMFLIALGLYVMARDILG